jgi:hypothetical protein
MITNSTFPRLKQAAVASPEMLAPTINTVVFMKVPPDLI